MSTMLGRGGGREVVAELWGRGCYGMQYLYTSFIENISNKYFYLYFRREGMAAQQATFNLLNHMHSFHTKQSQVNK